VSPNLKQLWSAFPLGQPRHAPDHKKTVRESRQAQSRGPTDSRGSGSRGFRLLVAVASGTLLATVLTALGVRVLRLAPSFERRRGGRARSATRLTVSPTKGGSTMANLRRRLQALGDPNAPPEESQEQLVGERGNTGGPVERLAEYSLKEREPVVAAEGSAEAAEPVPEEERQSPEGEVAADLGAVGEEVSTVLRSAQEAAAQIRKKGLEEAERLRKEAESAAAAEIDEARRVAEADRADGSRIRAEAEADAKDMRAAADSFAEQRRTDAEREAAQIVDDAQKRLVAAEADAEQKVRQAEADARQRRGLLQAEVHRYEERIENILVVFRGMGSQLEDLLGGQRAESRNLVDASDEALEDSLRPGPSRSRVG
jgi:vacuolar-type H+-ATPase subunit E/Vma4